MDPAPAVEKALRESGVKWGRVARGEWGLTVPGGSNDLEIGLAVRHGMLVVTPSEPDRLLGPLVAAAAELRGA